MSATLSSDTPTSVPTVHPSVGRISIQRLVAADNGDAADWRCMATWQALNADAVRAGMQ